jgi:hypothetical protein
MRNYLWAAVTAALLVTPQVARSFEDFPLSLREKQQGTCRSGKFPLPHGGESMGHLATPAKKQ